MGEHSSDLSYCELRAKEIINTCDGRRLGRVVDIIFSCNGSDVKGIVVPYTRRVFFSRSQEIFIPWHCINKIGEDVILVALKDPVFPHKDRPHYGGHGYDGHDGGHDGDHKHRKDPCRDGCEPPHKPHHDKDDDCFPPPFHHDHKDGPRCDKKCEKCMLFDCAYRWKD